MAPDAAVDWQVVQAELEEINEAWKQARFDSLPHVVEILTSQVPEEAIQSLQEQRDAIEDIVDDVVHGYQNGFHKAFHNYSQILRVFSESAASISGLKENLNESRKLLGARNKQLQQLWCRSVTIRHIISLLDQIDNVSKVPARIEKLIAEKRYYAAVQLHLQSTGLLDREGLQGVGALQDVRSDLSKLRGTLFFKVVDDLQLYLYNKGEYSVKRVQDIDTDDDISNMVMANAPVSNGHPISRRTRTMRRIDNQLEGHVISNGFHHTSSIDGSSSVDGKEEDNFDNTMSEGVSHMSVNRKEPSDDETSAKETRWSGSGLPSWLAESTPNEFIDQMTKSKAPLHIKYLQTMVECLGLLGKVAAAGAIISQKLRPAIHELITEEIKARAAAIDACRPRLDQVSKTVGAGSKVSRIAVGAGRLPKQTFPKHGHHSGGNAAVGTSLAICPVGMFMGPLGRGQAAGQELLESILGLISQVLENHVMVGEMMEVKSAAQGDAGSAGNLNGDLSWNADPDLARAIGGYSLSFALTVIQSECQQLICDILRATPDAATADAAVQTARLASKLPGKDSSSSCSSEDGLSFAFRFTDTVFSTGGADGIRQRRNAAAQEGYGTGAVLSERGFYLIAAVYKPTLQFTDKVLLLLPPKYTQLGKDGLQSFVENFVKDQFLPLVRVDYRTRVQDALASPAAFRPKSRAGVLYESSVEKGRPVLQGPYAASCLANEVVSWAQAMPKYAGDFVEVAQALLERTLERCRAAYTEAVLGSLSSSIIGRSDVENLMRQESASTLLDSSYLMQLGRKAEESLDPEGMEVEMEINNLLLSYRPVKQDQLIGDDQKLILMAALSDSLEYVSESIEKLGQNTSESSFEKKKKKDSQNFHHHRRSSSALTTSLRILAEKYRSLSAECLRTLRVEMQLEAIYQLQCMSERGYMMDLDAEEPEDFIIALTMQVTRLDEEMMPYIPVHKRSYMFGGISGVVATFFLKALNNIGTINLFGVRQICRNCIAVEQALAALSSSNSDMVCQQLNRVRNYYELLNLPFEALIAFVTEHHTIYSFSEYSSLLKVNVAGRELPVDAVQRIGRILAPGL